MTSAGFALRNLSRNRRRTALSLSIVAAGTVALLLTAGFVRFSFDGLRDALIRGGLGHLEIAPAGGSGGRDSAGLATTGGAGIENWRAIRDRVEATPGVVAAMATQPIAGLVSVAGGPSLGFVGLGVEPDREERLGFVTKVDAGAPRPYASLAPALFGAVVARGLAAGLGVKVGDTVTLLALDSAGVLNAVDVRVAGIATTGVQDLDTRFMKVHLGTARGLLGGDRVAALVVGLDSTDHTDAAKAALERALADVRPRLAITTWRERASFYGQVRNLYLGIFWFLGAIVLALVVLAASNTLVMTVFERMSELATLRAIGTTRAQLATLLLWEAVWLALAGGALGVVAGAAAIEGINRLHLQMPPPPGAVSPLDLQLAFVPEAFWGAVLLMVVVLLVAATAPIARAVRVSIVQALREP